MDLPNIAQQTTTTSTASGSRHEGAPKDSIIIIKGKRTKRQRPTIVSHSSTSYNTLNSSPSSYSNLLVDTTAEDEDTANCLILLSKGHTNNNNNNNNMDEFSGYKFNSKRYIQTSTEANGFTGTYVYECKTCSRTFQSFQALGGHRASHKKPKTNEPDKQKPSQDEEEPLPQLYHAKKPSSKLHECSICGAEFSSGQALGGHMRRHRALMATNTALSLIPYSAVSMVGDHGGCQKSRDDGLCLDLDLNLPAQPEIAVPLTNTVQDQHFKFMANDQNKQEQSVRLSAAPTLVDCHY